MLGQAQCRGSLLLLLSAAASLKDQITSGPHVNKLRIKTPVGHKSTN